MAVVQTAEEIIKIIQDKGLQKALFDCFDDEEYLLEELDEEGEFETADAYLESVGLPKEYKKVAGRTDTSEFWSVIHFPVEDVYVKITGTYDSYGQYEHYYNSKVTQVFPKQVTTTVYDKQ
mgnify:FL=1